MKNKKKIINLLLGPTLFAIVMLIVPDSVLNYNERIAIGTVFWAAFWWITMPVHIAVTGFLPIIINSVIPAMPMADILANYSGEIIVLFVGADLIGLAWSETELDKRLALKCLCLVGPSAAKQITVWLLIATIFSTFLANVVVVLILTQMALAMLRHCISGNIMEHAITHMILMCIVWGAGIGGMGTPLGGTMNLIPIEYMETLSGKEFMYGDWILRLLPFLVVVTAVELAWLLLTKPKGVRLEGTKEYFQEQYAKLPPLSAGQILSAGALAAAVGLSFVRDFFADLFPGLKPAYLFMLIGFALFFVPGGKGSGEKGTLLTWEKAEPKMSWGLYVMFAGALAIGRMVSETGAANTIGMQLTKLNLSGGFETVLLFVAFTIVIAEISSNTTSAAIMVPLVISVTQVLNLNPVPYIFILSAAFNTAYMMPTSVRAIAVGNGLPPTMLLRRGFVLTVLSGLAISVVGYVFLQCWSYFGTL